MTPEELYGMDVRRHYYDPIEGWDPLIRGNNSDVLDNIINCAKGLVDQLVETDAEEV